MSQISPNIFQTFYQFSSRLSLTFQHIKNLDDTFLILASYQPFYLLTWSKIKNFDQNHTYESESKFLTKTVTAGLAASRRKAIWQFYSGAKTFFSLSSKVYFYLGVQKSGVQMVRKCSSGLLF